MGKIGALPRPVPPGSWWPLVGQALLEAVFPRTCFGCGSFLGLPPRERATAARTDSGRFPPPAPDGAFYRETLRRFVCRACADDFIGLQPPYCPCCGWMFTSREGGNRLCEGCLRRGRSLNAARSVGRYVGSLRRVIQAYKYRARLELSGPLGILLQAAYRHHWFQVEVDLVVPVPLHARRLRRRGFNQSGLLVRSWAAATVGEAGGPSFAPDGLVVTRPKATRPQTGLGAAERRRNLRGAFRIVQPEAVDGRHVLLVDDVYTTGATAQACARALKAAGARRVDLLTIARVDV
jgi:ComF family protein